jgi:rsbT antagonist protein RsbS
MYDHDDDFAIPIVRLWEHLLVPIQGEISDQQAAELSADVLEAVHRTGATNLLIDVSGVAVMDSHLCATFARLAASARMMGVHSVISGLTPEIVMTLQTMGVELEEIHTTLSLEEALVMLGIGKLTPAGPVAQPPSPYPPSQTAPAPAPPAGWPGPVSALPYGAVPPAGPGAIPPGPMAGPGLGPPPGMSPPTPGSWAPPGSPPPGAPMSPGGGAGPWSAPYGSGPQDQGGPPFAHGMPHPGQRKGDLDE